MNKNIFIRMAVCLSALIYILWLPPFVYAHGDGASLEKIAGDYLIDIGYSDSPLRAGEQVRFDFNIWNKGRTSPVEFTDAWVRISPRDGFGTIFAADLHNPEFGLTGMTYTFPKGGAYELAVRFQKNGEAIGDEASFSLTVEDDPSADKMEVFSLQLLLGFASGILISGIAVFLKKK